VVKRLVLPAAPAFVAMVVVIALVSFWGSRAQGADAPAFEWLSATTAAIALGALLCEYVDSTLGMGYGTTLTPVLLMFGFKALDIVPAVLFSELFTGLVAAVTHHNAGNVSLKPGTKDFKVSTVLALCSVVGTLAAVFVAVSIPKMYLKLYIGVLVLVMGVLILISRNRVRPFSWGKIVGLGAVASFNKGMSGGGYGPLVTAGQILSGVEGKSAVGITSFAEGLTCAVGVAAYCLITKGAMPWNLAAPLAVGALLSVPFSAWSVKKISARKLTLAIGVLTTALGILTLVKVVRG
jgi:uncharacterized membrane protein YfcA